MFEPGEVPTVAAGNPATGVHSGVGVGVGVFVLVGDGWGVGVGGVPGHTLSPMIANGFSTVVLLEPPPPQLIISAVAKKDTTGTSTRHRFRQIIEP